MAGVTLPYFIEPGLRVGARWSAPREAGWNLVYGGDLAVGIDGRDKRSASLSGAFGALWLRESGFAWTVEGGLGLTLDHETRAVTVEIGSGGKQAERDWVGWVVPRLTNRLSIRNHRAVGAYLGVTWGHEIGLSREGAMVIELDVGLTWRPGAAKETP